MIIRGIEIAAIMENKVIAYVDTMSYVCIVKIPYIYNATHYLIMSRYGSLEYRITARIARKKCAIFVREDFQDLSDYDQVGRALRKIAKEGRLVRLGYGVYAKTKKSTITGEIVPVAPLPVLAKEALARLGIQTAPSRLEQDYNAGKTTQVPTGRLIAVKGRINRKIGYGGAYVSYEPAT